MGRLVLFSLDTLVNVPRLYSKALERASADAGLNLTQQEILEVMAERYGAGLPLLFSSICHLGHHSGFARFPAKSKIPYDEAVRHVSEVAQESDELKRMYSAFVKHAPAYARESVKPDAHHLLKKLKHSKTGIFYQIEEPLLEKVVSNSRLKVDVVAGVKGEKSTSEIVEKAQRKLREKEALLVVVDRYTPIDYRSIAKERDMRYIGCEPGNAPLVRVTSVLTK